MFISSLPFYNTNKNFIISEESKDQENGMHEHIIKQRKMELERHSWERQKHLLECQKLKLEINNGLFETEKVKFQRKLVKKLIF